MGYILKEKGITLVALVITIIILIILAGIGLAMFSGQDGIISKSNDAKKEMIKESIKEITLTNLVEKELDSYDSETFEQFKTKVINELRSSKLIDDNTKIINGFIVLDNENIISLYTGNNAIIGDSSEWEYFIYDANYTIESIQFDKLDEAGTEINYTIYEQGNENNKVAGIIGYKGSKSDIVIPEVIIDNNDVIPVTRLGDHWQSQNFSTANISNIKVLDNIKIISTWAFDGNSHIESVSIGNGVECIQDGAFHNCSNLKNVSLGKNVKYIGHDAFKLTKIEKIDFPNSLLMVGSLAFEQCTKIKNLTIGNNITVLGNACFRGCTGLELVQFNSVMEEIPEECFTNDISLMEIHIPSNIKKMGNACFRNCTGLKSIQFNNVMEEIPDECFAFDNNLTEINIPSNIKKIGKQAFMYVGHKYDDTGVGYGSNVQPKLKKIVLKEGLQEIGFEAFTGAKSVEENLRLPSSVTTIGTNAFNDFGTSGGGLLYKSDGTLY